MENANEEDGVISFEDDMKKMGIDVDFDDDDEGNDESKQKDTDEWEEEGKEDDTNDGERNFEEFDEETEREVSEEIENNPEFQKIVEQYPDLPDFLVWSGTKYTDLVGLPQKAYDILGQNYDRYVELKKQSEEAKSQAMESEAYAERLRRDGVVQARIAEIEGKAKFDYAANIDIDKIIQATAEDEETFRETVKKEFEKAMEIARAQGRKETTDFYKNYESTKESENKLSGLFKDLGNIDKALKFDFDARKARSNDPDFGVKYRNSEVGKFLTGLINQGFTETAIVGMGADKLYKLYLIDSGKQAQALKEQVKKNVSKITGAFNASQNVARGVSPSSAGSTPNVKNGVDVERAKTDDAYWQRHYANAINTGDFDKVDFLESLTAYNFNEGGNR
jgi:hypothetical protein